MTIPRDMLHEKALLILDRPSQEAHGKATQKAFDLRLDNSFNGCVSIGFGIAGGICFLVAAAFGHQDILAIIRSAFFVVLGVVAVALSLYFFVQRKPRELEAAVASLPAARIEVFSSETPFGEATKETQGALGEYLLVVRELTQRDEGYRPFAEVILSTMNGLIDDDGRLSEREFKIRAAVNQSAPSETLSKEKAELAAKLALMSDDRARRDVSAALVRIDDRIQTIQSYGRDLEVCEARRVRIVQELAGLKEKLIREGVGGTHIDETYFRTLTEFRNDIAADIDAQEKSSLDDQEEEGNA